MNPARGSLPGEPPGHGEPADWLSEKLFEHRIVVLTGRLDDAVAGRVAAELLALDAAADEPIELHVDSPDGTLEAAFVLIDTLALLRAPVRVRCRGQVGGPVVGVVAAADHRAAAPHTRFRLAQPVGKFSGTPHEIAAHNRQQQELLWRFHACLAQVTGRPVEEVAEDVRRGRYLDAGGALGYGLIDAITTRPR
jgi:ATP-dependent Clp protease protease subunit